MTRTALFPLTFNNATSAVISSQLISCLCVGGGRVQVRRLTGGSLGCDGREIHQFTSRNSFQWNRGLELAG